MWQTQLLYPLRSIWIINRRHTHTHVLKNKLNIYVSDQLWPYQQEQILKPQTYKNGSHQIHIGSICGLLLPIFHQNCITLNRNRFDLLAFSFPRTQRNIKSSWRQFGLFEWNLRVCDRNSDALISILILANWFEPAVVHHNEMTSFRIPN